LKELQHAAAPFISQTRDVLLMTEWDLKQFLISKNIPIWKPLPGSPSAPAPVLKQTDAAKSTNSAISPTSLTGPTDSAKPREPSTSSWDLFPNLRLSQLMENPIENFAACLDAVNKRDTGDPNYNLSARTWAQFTIPEKIPWEKRVDNLQLQYQAAKDRLALVKAALATMHVDDAFSYEDIVPYNQWRMSCELEVSTLEKALESELTKFQELLHSRCRTDQKMLEQGLVDNHTFAVWSNRRLQTERYLNDLKHSLQRENF